MMFFIKKNITSNSKQTSEIDAGHLVILTWALVHHAYRSENR